MGEGGGAISKGAHDRNEKKHFKPRGGTPLLEANRDVPLDGVAFSRLE